MTPSAAAICTAFQCGRLRCSCAKGRQVHCPAHEDAKPSLSVTDRGGRTLVKCHAGCSQQAVIDALRERRLWPERSVPATPAAHRHPHLPEVRHEIRDPDGRVVAVHVRRGAGVEKKMWWERPDGRRGLNGQRVEDLPLYGVHLLRDRPGEPVILAEGERAAQALLDAGCLAVGTVCGAAVTPSAEVLRPLVGREILLWPDSDGPGMDHMGMIDAVLCTMGVNPEMLKWADAPEKGDAYDYIQIHGADKLNAILKTAPAPTPNAANLLDEVRGFIAGYVATGPHELDALALWAVGTHVADVFDVFPYLHISSPEKRAGKTRLLEALSMVVCRPWFTGRVTAAVLVRKVAAQAPTLLLDETDAAMKSGDEYAETLRGVLNAGYRRGAVVSLCVGQGAAMTFADFPVYCPKAFAGIGSLPDTIMDRAIPVRLKRRRPDEIVGRWRWRDAEAQAAPLHAQLGAWVRAVRGQLADARPETPPLLHDRAGELWEVLLAVADLAGRDWPRRGREAAVALHTDAPAVEETLGVQLLAAIRDIFEAQDVDRLSTATLLQALVERDDGPWPEWWGVRVAAGDTRGPSHRLARALRPWNIRPQTIRIDEQTLKGFYRADFEDIFARYLATYEPKNVTSSQPALDAEFDAFQSVTPEVDVADEKLTKSAPELHCDDVTFPAAPGGGGSGNGGRPKVQQLPFDHLVDKAKDRPPGPSLLVVDRCTPW